MPQISATIEKEIQEFVDNVSKEKGVSFSQEVNNQLKFAKKIKEVGYEATLCKFGNYLFSKKRIANLKKQGVSDKEMNERLKIVTPSDIADWGEKV